MFTLEQKVNFLVNSDYIIKYEASDLSANSSSRDRTKAANFAAKSLAAKTDFSEP